MSKPRNSKPYFVLFLSVIFGATLAPPLMHLAGLTFCSPIQGGAGASIAALVVENTLVRLDLIILGFAGLVALLTILFVKVRGNRFTALLGAGMVTAGLVSGIHVVPGAILPEGTASFFDQMLPAAALARLGAAAIALWSLVVIRWGHSSRLKTALAQFLAPAAIIAAATWVVMARPALSAILPLHAVNAATVIIYSLNIVLLYKELRHHRLRFFGHGVLAAAIPISAAEVLLAFTVHSVIDDTFQIATLLRWFAWMIPAAALGIDYVNTFYAKGVNLEMRYLRSVIDAIPHYIYVRDTEGRYILVNQATAAFYGLQVHEVEGRHIADVHNRPEQCDQWLAEDRAVIAAGATGVQHEHMITRPDGAEIWINSIKTPVTSQLGLTNQVLGVSIDISEQRRGGQALAEALDAAKASNKAKTEFLANMSHEIRTPMNCVIGLTDLLKEMEPTPQQQQYLDMIRTSGAALLTLINDILDISKIEAGQLELDLVDTDLQTLIEETVSLIAFTAQAKGLEVVCRLAPGVPASLMLDPGRLRQVLTNLLNNATKFTQNGHVYLNIEPVGEEDGRVDLCFRVVDTGIGIARRNLDRIFEKFTQAEAGTTRRFGGTGLGLSISQHLVNLMGGRISATSEVGVGTTFEFTLPLQPTAAGLEPTQVAARPEQRVLVATHHDLGGEVLAEQVRSLGHTCRVAVGSRAAAEALRLTAGQEDWTCLLVDQSLAEDRDSDLSRAMANLDPVRRPRRIMLVELARLHQQDQLDSWGFDGILHKPARLGQLSDTLQGRLEIQAPVAPVTPSPAPPAPPTDAKPEPDAGPRILLAEDNPFNQKVATAMLRLLGCRIDVAATGVEAVDLVRRHEYDLVLMDCQMPVLDGYEATRRIRELPAPARDTHVVAMTANALSGDKRACYAVGMNDFMSKPITKDMLREMLTKWDVPVSETETVSI